VTLAIDDILGDRQRVTNSLAEIPRLALVRRDALVRTIKLELRKVI
jgi:hypothetical protein